VSPRVTALLFAVVAIGLTAAQDLFPARDWYHAWPYITIVAIAIVAVVVYAWNARTGADGHVGRRLALAMLGAAIVGVAGLISGLCGPDTVTVVGTPGTVIPVPDLAAAAFFAPADAASIERGDTVVTLRRRGAPPVEVGRHPVPLDLSVVLAEPRPAAFVIARDPRGERLTVTQPSNPSFLSPVLLFRATQPIRDRSFPLDTFAVPAEHRIVHALYFSPADLAAFRHLPQSDGGIVLSAADERGAEQGLTIAASGHEVPLAGLRLTLTMGTYPVLIVASAPQPFAVIGGLALFVAAGFWAMVPFKRSIERSAALRRGSGQAPRAR
jgi:hypothetical protein